MFENLKPSAIVCYRAQADEMTQVFPNIRVLSLEDLLECEADLDALERSLSNVTDTDPIYIMYTSGSTGMPKGVTIPHIGVIDYAHWVVERFGFDENTVMANQSAFYFDNSIFDIYGSMLCGCRLVIVPESMYMFPSKLPQYLRDHDITSIFWVPSIMINVDVGAPIMGHEVIIVTGEKSAVDYVDGLMRENGLAVEVNQDIYSSDCIPFADRGVAAFNFMRPGAPGAGFIHDRNDQLFFLSPEGLNGTLQTAALFTEHVANCFMLPVAKTVPSDITEKVDKYLFKKK